MHALGEHALVKLYNVLDHCMYAVVINITMGKPNAIKPNLYATF